MANRGWLAEQLETKQQKEIADELGVSRSVVYHWVNKHGLLDELAIRRSKSIRRALAEKYPEGRNAENSSNWRGGIRIADGYIYQYAPWHPSATPERPHVQEHRLIMEEKLGRLLEPDEIVHHKDGDRMNNDPDNLVVKTRGEHLSDHFKASHEVLKFRGENVKLRQRISELEERIKELEE